jgi:hypothetical protein
MGLGIFHQRNVRPAAPAQAVAEAGNKFQSRRAAAHDDDVTQRLVIYGLAGVHRRNLRQVARQPITPARLHPLHVE